MKNKIIILFLFVMSFCGYTFLFIGETKDNFLEKEIVVKRVIDGDTIETSEGEKIRLLGINTPEKNSFMSKDSISYLKGLENKIVKIKYKEKDKYGRILGYILFEGKNINEEILKEGLGNLYVYKKDVFYEELKNAEKEGREKEKGIWKKSKNYGCIKLIEFIYTEEEKCTNKEKIVLENLC
ncbi:MAG: thermonuclease family protein, partial [Candidatus Pacearchaeota archaeon]